MRRSGPARACAFSLTCSLPWSDRETGEAVRKRQRRTVLESTPGPGRRATVGKATITATPDQGHRGESPRRPRRFFAGDVEGHRLLRAARGAGPVSRSGCSEGARSAAWRAPCRGRLPPPSGSMVPATLARTFHLLPIKLSKEHRSCAFRLISGPSPQSHAWLTGRPCRRLAGVRTNDCIEAKAQACERALWTPSPCSRLSRPRTTTGPTPHPNRISRRRAFPPTSSC